MQMNITEKILARAAGQACVQPGEFIWATVDNLMIHDPCAPGVIGNFYKEFGADATVWDKNKVIAIPDHFIYTTDEKANRNINLMREFAQQQDLKYFYNPGSESYEGVCHVTLAQEGHIQPGKVLIGTDSHTVTGGAFGAFATGVGNTDASYVMGTGEIFLRVPETILITFTGTMPSYLSGKDLILKVLQDLTVQGATYMALEFAGDVIENLSVEERMTICNMAIEAGAKNAVMKVNEATLHYLRERTDESLEVVEADAGANYRQRMVYDVSTMEPMVAKPHRPDNGEKVVNMQGAKITRGYIGSCTGGKFEDLRDVAHIVKGRQVVVDTYAVPATKKVIRQLVTEKIGAATIYQILVDAGIKVALEPSCAACCGGPYDTFGRLNSPEICISTTNRNFQGRMGHSDSSVYLASPKTVAASALTGVITDVRDC